VFPNEDTQAAPFTLNCMYCQWSSMEIGLEFEKPTGIHGLSQRVVLSLTMTRTNIEIGGTKFGGAGGV
jgi:hypothetical protein